MLVEEVTYPGALDLVRGAGMRPVGIPLDDGGVDRRRARGPAGAGAPALRLPRPGPPEPDRLGALGGAQPPVAELSARYRVPVVEDLALRDLRMADRAVPAPIAAHDPEALVIIDRLDEQGVLGRASASAGSGRRGRSSSA